MLGDGERGKLSLVPRPSSPTSPFVVFFPASQIIIKSGRGRAGNEARKAANPVSQSSLPFIVPCDHVGGGGRERGGGGL